jgi:hypothetical protein
LEAFLKALPYPAQTGREDRKSLWLGRRLGFISLGENEVSEEERIPSWRKSIGY